MSWDPVWEEIFTSQEWGKYPGEDVIRFIARNFYKEPEHSRIKLLEVGSGTGANLWYMAREGFSAHGIEGSASAVAQTIARLDRECPGWREAGGEVRVGDIIQLPYPDSTFHAVLDVGALPCNSWENSKRIYAEMARVTKPGGKLFSRVLATGCWGDGIGEPQGRNAWICNDGPLKGKGLIRFTDESEVEELLQGWDVTTVERMEWTEGNRQHVIRNLIIQAAKPLE